MLNLEVGKSYKNAKGEVVRIIYHDSTKVIPFRGDNGIWYPSNGLALSQGWEYDLVEEVESESKPDKKATMLKLEVGKSYKNGKGETVKIISHYKHAYEGAYPFTGDNGEYYTPSGGFTVLGQTRKDLVEELEPEKPEPKAPNRKELAGWFRKIADALESDEYDGFEFQQGGLTINQQHTYPESDPCYTEVSIDMLFSLTP